MTDSPAGHLVRTGLVVRLVTAVLAGVTVVLLGGALGAPPAAWAATSRTVTVTPGHGVPGAPFTVEYREPVGLLFGPCSADSVRVTYDSTTLGTTPLRQQGGDCVATLPAAAHGQPGRHEVRIAGTSVVTAYTVDAPSGPPTRQAAPTSPSPTRSTSPSAVPDTPAASTSAQSAPPDDRFTTPSGRAVTMPGPGASGGGSATAWVLTAGAILILGDLCLLALLTVRTRRARSP